MSLTRIPLVPDGPAFVVQDADSLRRLHDPGRRATIRRVRLAGVLDDWDLERRLNRAYFACGSGTGSVTVALTLLVCLAGAVVTRVSGAFGPWHLLIYLVTAALVGKVVGLAVARAELRRVERRLRDRLVAATVGV